MTWIWTNIDKPVMGVFIATLFIIGVALICCSVIYRIHKKCTNGKSELKFNCFDRRCN